MTLPHSKKISKKILTVVCITAIFFLSGCTGFLNTPENLREENEELDPENSESTQAENEIETNTSADLNNTENESEANVERLKEDVTDINIVAAGDIMFHGDQLVSAYDEGSKTYDFKSVFADVKPFIESADLALVNFETTLGGVEEGFSGYPMFSAPDETIDAIRYAGFDVLTTANNHSLDTGSAGLKRTVQVIREKGLSSVGSYDEKPESRVLMKDVEGIDIAILSYTESTNGLGDNYAAEELNSMLNMMDESIIREDIQEAKMREADLIITFMHWGEEYMQEPNAKQVEFAEMMAAEGVDIILGSHPHVIQKSEFIENNDHQTYVIYSMGNFVSNQRRETLGEDRKDTEDGVIVNLDIQKDNQTNETTIEGVSYTPTWVYRNEGTAQSDYTYRILPIEAFQHDDDLSQDFKDRMTQALQKTNAKMTTMPAK